MPVPEKDRQIPATGYHHGENVLPDRQRGERKGPLPFSELIGMEQWALNCLPLEGP